jgi:hypothetical protein
MSFYSRMRREQRRQENMIENQVRFEEEQLAMVKAGRVINEDDLGPLWDDTDLGEEESDR